MMLVTMTARTASMAVAEKVGPRLAAVVDAASGVTTMALMAVK